MTVAPEHTAAPPAVPVKGSRGTGPVLLVDVFDVYAASAVAASNSVSAAFSTFFPLCVLPLYDRLGLGWGNSLLALLFLVWLPVLFGLHRFGERIRRSAKFGLQKHVQSL